jgi:IMP cyclohydrolase
VGVTKTGTLVAAYLLSSRSFADRMIDIRETTAKVVQRSSSSKSYPPNLFYICIKIIRMAKRPVLLVGNGTHTDHVEMMMPREIDLERQVSTILEVLRYEKDEKKTPRIVGAVGENGLILGLISEKGLSVKKFEVQPGRAYYVSTYQFQEVGKHFIEDFVENSFSMIRILKETEPFCNFTDYVGSISANLTRGKLDLACD